MPATGAASAVRGERQRIVRSAAYALEFPFAIYLGKTTFGWEALGSFGAEPAGAPNGVDALLDPAPDRVLIVEDVATHRDAAVGQASLFAPATAPVRFIAAAPVLDAAGAAVGVLVVADASPHAGLSAAKTYVLRTHAAQLAAILELETLREVAGDAVSAATRRSNTERLRLLESVVVNANDAVLITEAEPIDLPGPRVVYCNAAFTRTTGYTEAEMLGGTPRILQAERTDRKSLDRLRRALTRWKPIEVELLNRRKDGTEFWVELSIVPVANEKGWFTHWVSVQRDVSDRKAVEETATRARIAEAENVVLEAEIRERKRVEAQLLFTAFHDDLTKLRNRAFLMECLAGTLDRLKRVSEPACWVLFMDLDRFKLVNDSLGHRAGDLLLMEVARRLRDCLRPQDTLARVGGDEFAMLIEGVEDAAAIVAMSQRILAAMRRPVWLDNHEVFTSCSIGVVQATRFHSLPEQVLRDADIAMYQAKRNDTGGYAIFADSMHDTAVKALELQTDLRNAVVRDEFFLDYQPIFDASGASVTGLEALIRWQHPQRGLVSPAAFIATAEETGLIRDVGRWVLREACAQMRCWHLRFPELRLRLSVNTSAEELKDLRFTSAVRETLDVTGLDPRSLQLEVTESIFLQKPELVTAILAGIRALGVRIALDDFGTGYSSLSYLDRYEIDTLKIDQTFVARMLSQHRTSAIVDTIIRLGQALKLDIVAEGVESDAQFRALVASGCGFVQGYLVGRPMSAGDVDALLLRQAGRRPAVSAA